MTFIHQDPEFPELLRIVAEARHIPVSLIEKDYWVTHTLWALQDLGLDDFEQTCLPEVHPSTGDAAGETGRHRPPLQGRNRPCPICPPLRRFRPHHPC